MLFRSEKSFVKKASKELWLKDFETGNILSIDLFLRNFSQKKQEKIKEFIDILKKVSIEKKKCTQTIPFTVRKSPKKSKKSRKSKRKGSKKSKKSRKSKRKGSKKSKRRSHKKH